MMNYEEIFAKWDALPDCRIRIDLGDGGENLWGKVLPDGTFGINNMPLHQEYQWQDIVLTQQISSDGETIFRRWGRKVYFTWDEPSDAEAASAARKSLIRVAVEAGHHPGFWNTGVAYILFTAGDLDDGVYQDQIREILKSIGFTPTFR